MPWPLDFKHSQPVCGQGPHQLKGHHSLQHAILQEVTPQSRSHHSLQHAILQEVTPQSRSHHSLQHAILQEVTPQSRSHHSLQHAILQEVTPQSQSHHSLQHCMLQEVQLIKVGATTAYSTLSCKRYNSTKSEQPQLTARYPARGTTQQSRSHHSLQHAILQEVQLVKVRATTAYSTLSSKR